jgi:molybdenum cofactor cytidylyltransferase
MDLTRALRITRGAVVTFTGAGGKTTAMIRLGRELAAAGMRVVATTTTRLGMDELDRFPRVVVNPTPAMLAAALQETSPVLVVAGQAPAEAKAMGLEPEQVAALSEVADVVLVEGDGSRRLPLKAPGPGEPVVPPTTTHLVCCVGLAALGRPLDETTVHRPERVAALTGLSPGAILTPAALARLLLHPDGPGRGAGPAARRYLLANGADILPDAGALEALWLRLAAAPQWEAVLTAQVAKEPPVLAAYGHLSAVVLAAGGSVRFGSPKQLAPWQGQPLLRHVVLQALAAPVQEIVVVLGAYYEETAAVLAGLPVTLVYNPDWEAGQSTSVRAGLRACAPQTQGVLFILGDQPHLPADLLQTLVATHRRTLATIVAPRHEGRRGNPMLFDRRCFTELLALSGDAGGRQLLDAHADDIVWFEAGPEILRDIDKPTDLGNE